MKKLTIAFMVAMAFVSFGCKKKGGGDTANAMAKMKEFRDEMCKCKDAKCAQDVSDKMTKWGAEQSKGKEPPKMNEADTAEFQKVGKEMGECMTKAMGAGGAMGGGTMEGSAAPTEGSAAAPAEGSAAAGSAAPAAEGSAAAGSAAAGSAAK